MRPYFFAGITLLSTALLAGSTGVRAENKTPPMDLQQTTDTVRVRVLKANKPSNLSSTGSFRYQLAKGGKIYVSETSVHVRAMQKSLVFDHKTLKGDVVVLPGNAPPDVLKLNGRRYRGALVFHPLGHGRYDVVEYLGLQEYLYGVLPREVGGEWPIESLKAQAVVSRTYLLANKATDPAQRFDVFNDVTHQVYGGLEDETALANQAVDETRGEILTDKAGNPIQAFFHSSCGGCTETPENVWLKQEPSDVFSSVPDEYCKADPYYHWQVDLKTSFIRARLRKAGYRFGDIKNITVGKKSSSGRAATLWIYTSGGKTEIQGSRFRMAMGPEVLRGTLLTDITRFKHGIHFEGRGWGHGIGLCQWGARGRALAGQTYDVIVKAYYPKAILKHVDGL